MIWFFISFLNQDQRALGPKAACRLVTKMLMETREDIKYSPRALILLIGLQLVDMKQLDEFLAKVRKSIILMTFTLFIGCGEWP